MTGGIEGSASGWGLNGVPTGEESDVKARD